MPVHFSISGGIGYIVIDNPPVNVISGEVRQGMLAALNRAEAAEVDRIIISGTGKVFVAGADANEFDTPPAPPHLPDILERIEHCRIPCIAALNGAGLGAGLEIALACRYRIAVPEARLGLPEVTLGLVPGAGGTQRLPRLVGMSAALGLIAQGKLIGAVAALKLGLINEVSDDPVAAAMALPDTLLTGMERICDLRTPKHDPAAENSARKLAAKRMSGQNAPVCAIDLVVATASLSFREGMTKERDTFLSLRRSNQARALRHLFFGERKAAAQARSGLPDPVEVTTAIVVGGGNMGASIAYALGQTGIDVCLVEMDIPGSENARKNVAKLFDQAVKRGKITAQQAETKQAAQFTFVVGYQNLPPAQIAIEAAFEDMSVKKQIFAALDAALPETAILATNTSYLNVNEIARDLRNSGRVLGLHFFSPAHIMKLLEVVRAAKTTDATMATSLKLAQRLGKISVPSGVCDGFIGNRILTRYRQTTDIIMLEGSLPWEIDAAMRDFGFSMGPYEVQDLSGLDIAYANRKRLDLKNLPNFRYIPIADRMVEELNRLGRKSGAGWYDYPEGASSQKPSTLVKELILDTARREGLPPKTLDAGEIQNRALTAMIEEACHILDEGIAARPMDIDLVLVHGYAFPRWRGGLLHYADTVGIPELLRRIETYAEQDPLSWSSPEILQRMARENRNFASLNLSPIGGN